MKNPCAPGGVSSGEVPDDDLEIPDFITGRRVHDRGDSGAQSVRAARRWLAGREESAEKVLQGECVQVACRSGAAAPVAQKRRRGWRDCRGRVLSL